MEKQVQEQALAKQYGGLHTGGWVNLLPASCIPYIQLCRLSPPVALFLIYFPHLFGIVHAATTHGMPFDEVQRAGILLLVGCFFCNNASHAWNDLVDAPIDARIERTRTRPIPRGAISPTTAFVFTASQSVFAAAVLLKLPSETAIAVVPTIIATAYYPFAKRHMGAPQLVLGFALTWGAMIGSTAMGVPEPWTDPSMLSLWVASVLWVVIFDTIYAHQDLEDDLKIGVNSTAVLFGSYTRYFLWVLLFGMIGSLIASGTYGHLGLWYYVVTVGGCVLSVGSMIMFVDLRDPANCWQWFSQGFWLTGLAIAGGLACELADRMLR